MSLDEPAFHNIAIVGFGLIGGSIALAIRERWPSIRITAVDRPAVLAHAAGSGAIDRAVQRVADLGGNDLVILAAPVEQNVRLLPEAVATISDGGLITDVGGTKRDIVNAACALPGVPLHTLLTRRTFESPNRRRRTGRLRVRACRPVPGAAVDSDAKRDEPRAGCGSIGWIRGKPRRTAHDDGCGRPRSTDGLSQPSATANGERLDGGRWGGSDSERPATLRARPHGLNSTCVESSGRLARSVRFERGRHRPRARSTDRALAAAQGRAHRCRDCRSCLRARRSLAIRADEGA